MKAMSFILAADASAVKNAPIRNTDRATLMKNRWASLKRPDIIKYPPHPSGRLLVRYDALAVVLDSSVREQYRRYDVLLVYVLGPCYAGKYYELVLVINEYLFPALENEVAVPHDLGYSRGDDRAQLAGSLGSARAVEPGVVGGLHLRAEGRALAKEVSHAEVQWQSQKLLYADIGGRLPGCRSRSFFYGASLLCNLYGYDISDILGPQVLKERVPRVLAGPDRKSTRLNSSHGYISYAVF